MIEGGGACYGVELYTFVPCSLCVRAQMPSSFCILVRKCLLLLVNTRIQFSCFFACCAQGEGLRGTIVMGQRTSFQVMTFDQQGERRVAGGDQIALRFEKPGEMKVKFSRYLFRPSVSRVFLSLSRVLVVHYSLACSFLCSFSALSRSLSRPPPPANGATV